MVLKQQLPEKRVLVVDDDEPIRKMVEATLTRELFTVETARDGVEAIEKLQSTAYDVVVVDLMMPRANGFEVIDFVRSTAPEKLNGIVVMTALHGNAVDQARLPVARVLNKPFDLSDLVANVVECHWLSQNVDATGA